MKKMILGVGVVLMGLLLMVGLVSAEIPHLINFQGRLTDSSGVPVPDGTPIKFSIYNVPGPGGNPLWSEIHPSDSDSNGIFNVLLGSTTALNLPFDEAYWLEIEVDGEVLADRQQITSVGYAFSADRVKGSNIFSSSGNVGIGTTSPTEKLQVAGKVKAQGFITGDITFQKDNEKLWRMFEDEDGLYLESLKTGKVYRFLLQEVENK